MLSAFLVVLNSKIFLNFIFSFQGIILKLSSPLSFLIFRFYFSFNKNVLGNDNDACRTKPSYDSLKSPFVFHRRMKVELMITELFLSAWVASAGYCRSVSNFWGLKMTSMVHRPGRKWREHKTKSRKEIWHREICFAVWTTRPSVHQLELEEPMQKDVNAKCLFLSLTVSEGWSLISRFGDSSEIEHKALSLSLSLQYGRAQMLHSLRYKTSDDLQISSTRVSGQMWERIVGMYSVFSPPTGRQYMLHYPAYEWTTFPHNIWKIMLW